MILNISKKYYCKSGIYKITNLINGKIYIGSAVNFKRRYDGHLYTLKRNSHHCPHLKRAILKYGSDNFIFEILEEVERKEELLNREQYYLDLLKPYLRSIGYNYCETTSSRLGSVSSEETKMKLSKSLKGRIVTKETRDKISLAQKGKPRLHRKISKEKYALMAEKRRGIPRSLEIRLKVSNGLLDHKVSEETRKKIREKNIGKKQSKRTIEKRRLSLFKPIFQLDLSGNVIKKWQSASCVEKELGFNGSHIRRCVLGERKTCNGFRWIKAITKD